MTPTLTKSPPEPFLDDLACLLAEFDWIDARCLRLGAQRLLLELEEETHNATPPRNRRRIARKLRRSIPALRRTEDEKRNSIDARLALNRNDGPTLGLDAIQDECGLTAFERTVLLLGCLAAASSSSMTAPATTTTHAPMQMPVHWVSVRGRRKNATTTIRAQRIRAILLESARF